MYVCKLSKINTVVIWWQTTSALKRYTQTNPSLGREPSVDSDHMAELTLLLFTPNADVNSISLSLTLRHELIMLSILFRLYCRIKPLSKNILIY